MEKSDYFSAQAFEAKGCSPICNGTDKFEWLTLLGMQYSHGFAWGEGADAGGRGGCGEVGQGDKGMRMCPLLPGEAYRRYNSLVNDEDAPSIFVVQHTSQAYPAYLVTYH